MAENLSDVLSVFDTLKETAIMWVRNFWYLAALALAFLVPDLILRQLHYDATALREPWAPIPALTISTTRLFCDVASVAALFGVLQKKPEESIWTSVGHSIKRYTWRLFRLIFLLGLVFFPVTVINLVAAHMLGSTKVKAVLEPEFYVFFILFAVCLPLVPIEKLGAKEAFKRGWGMIKEHFLYIAGCGLSPFLVEWLIRSALGLPLDSKDEQFNWRDLPLGVADGVLGSAWGILFWSVCRRIKETEARSNIDRGSIGSLPESPSASRNA